MKILHIITGLNTGGAETMLYRLVTRMDVVQYQSRVVSLIEPGPIGKKLQEAGVRVDTLGMQRGIPSPAGFYRLLKLIQRWQPDVVQTWLYHADLAGLMAAKIAFPFSKGPKVAWNIRCSFMALEEYGHMTSLTLRACAALSGKPDMVLTNSYEAKRFHTQLGYHPKQFSVIPNGFALRRYRPDGEARREIRQELSINEGQTVIGQVARFDPMKDHRTMIEAAAKVAKDNNAIFLLVGRDVDYDNLDLAAWLKQSGLPADRVRLLGERSDMARLMAAMDIHVSSSAFGEGFPNVVGESMACGVPNVVTNVGDSARLVGDTGIVIPPSDVQALANAMAQLISMDKKELKAMGQKARDRIDSHYSLPSVVAQYEAMYSALVTGP